MKERPTTDRAKEGLFNILENRFVFDGLAVLDLFAGTGSISYEICSRGDAKVTAVERDRELARFIARNAEEMGMEGLKVENSEVLRFLEKCSPSYGLIFADPPYGKQELYRELLERVRERQLLEKGGCLILEHDEKLQFDEEEAYRETRKFGNARFSFFTL